MNHKYFQMADDVESPGRWFLGSPVDRHRNEVDPELLRVARPVKVATPLTISVRRRGYPLDWTFADFDMPVVKGPVEEVLREIVANEVEMHRALVEGYEGEFVVANVLTKRRCVDEANSEYLKWTPADDRPDKLGQYRQFTRLRIDPTAAGDADIFRVDGWLIAIIVSEKIKNRLEEEGVTGVVFTPVVK
jgi:hypothetical protein